MKGLIIKNAYYNASQLTYQVNSIKKELEDLGVLVDVLNNSSSVYIDSDCTLKSKLKKYDFCVFLDKDKYLGKMIESLGILTFNKISAIETCDDKALTLLKLLNSGIKVPKTISAPLCFTSNSKVSSESLDEIIDILGLPLVAKKSFSSLGKGVYLIKSKLELENFINENPFEPKIYQEFISSSYGRDVRIICIGKKYYSSMLRYSEDDFRSNSALGGKAKPFNPPVEFIEVAEKVANLLDLDYMGIDLLFDKDGAPVLCEVNSNAYFTVMDEVCKVNVAREYAKHIVKTVKQKQIWGELWFQIALKI